MNCELCTSYIAGKHIAQAPTQYAHDQNDCINPHQFDDIANRCAYAFVPCAPVIAQNYYAILLRICRPYICIAGGAPVSDITPLAAPRTRVTSAT